MQDFFMQNSTNLLTSRLHLLPKCCPASINWWLSDVGVNAYVEIYSDWASLQSDRNTCKCLY
jgi:hypothetical protein